MRTTWSDENVVIRPYVESDVDALYEAVRESVDEVGRWLSWCHPAYSRAESVAWIASRRGAWAKGEAYGFGIFDTRSEMFLGGCGLNHFNHLHQFANLGYWIRTSQAGRGIATAAAQLVARFGFEALGLVRVEIVVSVANLASQRVAEKLGATREGVLRNRLIQRDGVTDSVMFSLIPEDLGLATRVPV
ncbi:MAG: GNAT family N-acetyltransferase [Rhodothermales bacterium]